MWRKSCLLALATTPLVALADANYDEAEVVDVEPVIETVRYIEPEEKCRFEAVRVAPAVESATKPLLGALIGGTIGNAMGTKKRNKQVGAVVGALVGGAIASDVASTRPRETRRVRQEVCEVVEHTKRQERVTGYMVTYRYRGETYRARMDKRPGATIRVRVRVSPA